VSVSQFHESPLRAYTLFPRRLPSCLATAHVSVTSASYCRGGKRLDSREFQEKNFLIRVHKRFALSCATFRRRKNVLYARGFSGTKCRTKCERSLKPRRTLIPTAEHSHTFSFSSKCEFSNALRLTYTSNTNNFVEQNLNIIVTFYRHNDKYTSI